MSKPRILICTSYYKPGFKGGGPIKSIGNIVSALKSDYDFDIITLDRDLTDNLPYVNIVQNDWNILEDGTRVFYYSPKKFKIKTFFNLTSKNSYQFIYLNSLYSKQTRMVTYLNKMKLIKCPVLIAPRGEVEKGALELKTKKKMLFLKINKFLNLYKEIYWHATNTQEKQDIKKHINNNKIYIASNIGDFYSEQIPKRVKRSGKVNCVFISRISPKKNLLLSLKAFKEVKGEVIFDIYGPIEDEDYYKLCIEAINILPKNVKVNFKGGVTPEKIKSILSNYHFFIFPTLGENYGHVIYEALNLLVPVVTTKNVPEKNLLEKNIGINIGYEVGEWIDTLQNCIDIDQEAYSNIIRSLDENKKHLDKKRNKNILNTKEMFNSIINMSKNEGFYEKRT